MPASLLARILLLPLLLASLLLGGTVLQAPHTQAVELTRAEKIKRGATIAVRQIGDPYRYGASGPGAFDCSGLTYFSYRRAGFSRFPRTTDAQARFTRHIRKSNLRRGDFLFFHNSGDVYHVAIFIGRNRQGQILMLHSPRSGETVKYARPWTRSWFAGTLRRRG